MYRIVEENIHTKQKEVIDLYYDLSIASRDLEEIRELEKTRIGNIVSPIIDNIFYVSSNGRHLKFTLEQFDAVMDCIFEALKPQNQN